ncbi:MAG: sigma factor-like helix-turn-helix DNA-binding protein [Phycisphaerae bacterium]|nr:sigma factor-like helix-turn-helix DNA-binding protein [Phycisphaerae bacterium]
MIVNECRDLAARERRRAAREAINVAVTSLPDRQREVVLLCYHAELTPAQAAEILMIP